MLCLCHAGCDVSVYISVSVHVYVSMFFLCVSVFFSLCFCVCVLFYSVDLCGLIQIKKEKKRKKEFAQTERSLTSLIIKILTLGDSLFESSIK